MSELLPLLSLASRAMPTHRLLMSPPLTPHGAHFLHRSVNIYSLFSKPKNFFIQDNLTWFLCVCLNFAVLFFFLSPFFIQSHFMVLSCIRYLTGCCFCYWELSRFNQCSFFMTDDSQSSDLYSHYIITCKISIYEGYNGYTKSWSSLKRAHSIEWENAYNLLVTLLG